METHYQKIGGEETIRRLVDRFYEIMDEDPDYYGIRKLHPQDLSGARSKLFMFLSGWTGGPQLYVEKFGHPRLRQRHLPFAIGEAERDQWMGCMMRAMDDVGVDDKSRRELTAAFQKTADFMRNKEA
ncbi:MAG: group II truncated hemoglobin [Sulfurimicrobium sp.]